MSDHQSPGWPQLHFLQLLNLSSLGASLLSPSLLLPDLGPEPVPHSLPDGLCWPHTPQPGWFSVAEGPHSAQSGVSVPRVLGTTAH